MLNEEKAAKRRAQVRASVRKHREGKEETPAQKAVRQRKDRDRKKAKRAAKKMAK